MTSLSTQIERLSTQERAYVYARSKVSSDAKAARDIGLSPSAVSRWDNKDALNDLANQLQADRFVEAEMALRDKMMDAVETVFDIMMAGDKDHTRLRAAEMVIDRTLGPVTNKVSVEVEGLDELAQLAKELGVPLGDLIRANIDAIRGANASTDGE